MPRPRAGPGASSGASTKSTRTRQRILEAAAQVLDQRGYAGTRVSEIARIASVQAPALYYYFPSRDALVEQVVVTGQDTIIDHVVGRLSALPESTTSRERLAVGIAAHLEVALEHSDFSSATLRNAGQLPAPIREKLLDGQHTYGEVWRGVISHLVDAGELAPGLDPGIARMLVLGILNWAPQWFDPDRGSLATVVDTARRFITHALTRGLPEGLRDTVAAQAPAGVDAR
jgi:AcrR family transcriptional regulator